MGVRAACGHAGRGGVPRRDHAGAAAAAEPGADDHVAGAGDGGRAQRARLHRSGEAHRGRDPGRVGVGRARRGGRRAAHARRRGADDVRGPAERPDGDHARHRHRARRRPRREARRRHDHHRQGHDARRRPAGRSRHPGPVGLRLPRRRRDPDREHRRAERRDDVRPGDHRPAHPEDELAGKVVAGTGTIDVDGRVGPIGGIEQKMHGALRDGAHWFLAPSTNCDEVVGRVPRGLQVVKVSTLAEARDAITRIGAGDAAGLPTCS
ncbi:S16 family serine protease [Xylanimonas protaetiae]|uniref:S16 family serine protease n=1 Tax=Xylanimonas protaetiae TaxID=2509457 RepID=UPI001F5C3CEA|nr:S16 family serine protease [Xylanimonas protaetiae]